MTYLTAQYNPWGVLVSVLIGSFASYVALDLARRVQTEAEDRIAALAWWAGGSLALGTGIWSMHFVGMLAFSLPIALGYTKLLTFLSWLAGVAVSATALSVANRHSLSGKRLLAGALMMGSGICAMHYLGMAAMDMVPGIDWNPYLVAASVVIAVSASAVALLIFFWLREAKPQRALIYQVSAAVVMGIAISGMHYTGMAAANFRVGAYCLSAGSLSGNTLSMLVIILAALLLASTLMASTFDVRRRLTRSLEVANAKLQAANDELQKRAFIDALTGLPNRVLFEDRLAHAVARLTRSSTESGVRRRLDISSGRHETIAVLFVDLDGFKTINDSLGHAAGDRVLIEVAQRLSRAARASDTVARLGGDEFVLLMESAGDQSECANFVRRLLQMLCQPVIVGGQPVDISASVGIALYPDHGDRHELLSHADAAMYAAKRAGRGGYSLFETYMDAGARDLLSLQNDLRRAKERGQLQLHYQPKIHGRPVAFSGQISGVEALLRWHHPQRGMIGPNTFIPIAERMGLMKSLGDWVIDEACRQMRAWADDGLEVAVAINLSVYQLRDSDLLNLIQCSLERYRIEPSQLLCEITESAAMEDLEATRRVFEAMGRIGVYLAIDDFGTGYSSLSHLRELPARQLKIDQSFVTDLETNTDARAVVHAVINLAHALDLRVVAEGVETDAQRAILSKLKCDEMQGYLFARPMPADALRNWLSNRKAACESLYRPAVAGAE
jgi:diguanylate cyclase (GGDEF)-like protein